MSSIRLRLLKWLIGPILLVNLAGAALAYTLAWAPAQLAFDQRLGDAVAALSARVENDGGALAIDLPRQAEQVLRADQTDAIYFAVRRADGSLIAGDADFDVLRPGPAYDRVLRGEPVRALARALVVGGVAVKVGVARTLRQRAQMRAAIVGALLPLEALFTFALAGMIWFSVTSGLAPLDRLRANLHARAAGELAPIDDGALPLELAPVARAFNGLLDKVHAGAQAQHDFLADVAHQLRTPLAGLGLQLEWLAARHAGDPDSVRSLDLMLQSNNRMIRQTNQLLALARAEPSRFETTRLEQLDLAALVQQAIQGFVEHARRRRIDLGFELAPTVIGGQPFLLRDLIDNLVDNALRYTPPGGAVTVRCRRDGLHGVLEVEDSGPGIAPAMREAVFARFVRLDQHTTGSGLGLAIVRDIAAVHAAQVGIETGAGGSGARFTVRFPA
ncbi:MAG: sensor histidine kinase [Massilia sp.]